MYHPTVEELNKTPWEKQMAQQMTLDNSGVTLSYRNVLYIIQQHLKTLYGDMADWNKNLGIYLRSEERKHSTLFADKIENVLEITTDHLRAAMQFEEQNQRMAAKACELYQNWCNTQNVQSLALAAEILGVFPGESRISLNEYYVVFPGEKEERKKIRAQVLMDENSIGLLSMVVNLMVSFYRDGLLCTYPGVGTMITQPRGKLFWRGENAYYGSSKPSIYRSTGNLSPELFQTVTKMRYDECGKMLDQMEAPLQWSRQISDVSYMAIMQHYGLPTHMLDITGDIKTALFFACCKWKQEDSFSRWEPLRKCDFEKKDSRPNVAEIGGDSRYGMIYKARTEIEDLMWLVVEPAKNNCGENSEYQSMEKHVIPVGYQPFNRCRSQHAYMVLGIQDLYLNAQFDKAKFLLDEDFCEWIYEEMGKGEKIYPHKDVPDITKYISKIANTHIFSKSVFDEYCKLNQYNQKRSEILKNSLKQEGFFISDRELTFIEPDKLKQLNEKYTLEDARRIADIKPVAKPMIVITG